MERSIVGLAVGFYRDLDVDVEISSRSIRIAVNSVHARPAQDIRERLHEFQQTVRALIEEDVRVARTVGASWVAVGDALDMTRQATHE